VEAPEDPELVELRHCAEEADDLVDEARVEAEDEGIDKVRALEKRIVEATAAWAAFGRAVANNLS
jgi:hypothetical protein